MSQKAKELLFLDPVCTHNIWGGTRLREEFGCAEAGDDLGECWGISAHPNGDGTIKNGVLRVRSSRRYGRSIQRYLEILTARVFRL